MQLKWTHATRSNSIRILLVAQSVANNIVLSGTQTQIATTTKFMIRLSQSYLEWLFVTGKYQHTDPLLPDWTTDLALVGKFIAFDAADAALAGGQTDVKQGQGFGTFGTETMNFWNPSAKANEIKSARANVIPARDRVQAVKEAAIRTWINYQTRVFWAFRFLDDVGEAANGGATTINNDSKNTKGSGVPTTWTNGNDTGWTLLNNIPVTGMNNSVTGMNRIAALFPYTNTPLCYATARALAQFTDPDNIFGDAETGTYPVECQKHFLILFTDGVPTSEDNKSGDNSGTPYITTDGGNTGSAQEGNTSLIVSKTSIDPGNKWWNIFTYAGAAAHLSDDTKGWPAEAVMAIPTYPAGDDSPSAFLPFAIPARKTVTIPQPYRLVTTMTIGVSLYGQYTDAASPKRRLFLAAAVGDPDRTSWDLSTLTPFTLKDPAKPDDPNNSKTDDSVFFFDATSPDLLTNYLSQAFKAAGATPQTGTSSVPVIPWIGGGLSDQIYLASFTVPKGGGPVWSGDVRMFPTKDVAELDTTTGSKTQTLILDNTGTEITGDLSSAANPGWSASAKLISKGWRSRKIYTRLPSTSSTSNPPILSFLQVLKLRTSPLLVTQI